MSAISPGALAEVGAALDTASVPRTPLRPMATPPAKVTIATTGMSTSHRKRPYPPDAVEPRVAPAPMAESGAAGTAKPAPSSAGGGLAWTGPGGTIPGADGRARKGPVSTSAGGAGGGPDGYEGSGWPGSLAGMRSKESVMGSFGLWAHARPSSAGDQHDASRFRAGGGAMTFP